MKISSIILLSFLSICGYGQISTDTLYYNANWKTCPKDSAQNYRLSELKDSLYLIKDFYLDGTLKMLGHSTTKEDSLFRVGEFTFYNKEGQLTSKLTYIDNKIHGIGYYYFENGSIYSTKEYQSGKADGDFKYYFPDLKIRRHETYKNDSLIDKKCYSSKGTDTTYYSARAWPEFKGGQDKMQKYLSKNIKYPEDEEGKIYGNVTVGFAIDKQGEVCDVYIVKSLSTKIDKNALKVISQMPNWTPGRNNDINVKVKFKVNLIYNLPR